MPQQYKFQIRTEPKVVIALVILVLAIPIQWISAWLIAACTHELFHCVGVYACGGRIYDIRIGLNGAKIETGGLSVGKEVFCLLIGSIGTLAWLLVSHHFPRLCICAALQSAYNLLPLPSLDGGQALRRALDATFKPSVAENICKCVQYITILLIVVFFLYCSAIWEMGILPIVLVVIFLIRYMQIKIPCKRRRHRVQ